MNISITALLVLLGLAFLAGYLFRPVITAILDILVSIFSFLLGVVIFLALCATVLYILFANQPLAS